MKPSKFLQSFLLAAGSSLLAISSASAQSWDGSSSGAWLDGTNWGGDVAAGSTTSSDTDIAGFGVNANNTININMTTTGGNYYLGAIDNTNSAARTITNTTGTSGILTLNSATVNSVANTIIRNSTGGSLTIRNDTTSGTLGLALAGSSNIIQITSNGAVTINSIISGSGGIARQGTGSANLSFTGNNSYTGVTAISGGVLAISNSNALGATGTGNHTTIAPTGAAASGRLSISGTINSPENITITGITETGAYNPAILNTANTNTLSGNITLAGTGGIKIAATGGTLNLTGNITQTTTSHALVLQPNGASASINVSKPIANNGGELILVGLNGTAGGTVTLNDASGSGIGATTLAQTVTLRLGVTNALNTSANLTLSYGGTNTGEDRATLDLRGFNQTVNALIGNVGTGASPSANSSRLITNGVAGTSILTVGNGNGSGIFRGQINSGTGNIQLIKTGSGNQTLSDENSYTGGTRIDAGTLTLGHSTNTLANSGAVNVNGGTLALGTNTDIVGAVTLTSGSITGTGAGRLTGSSFGVQSGTISAKLGGSGAMTKTTAGTVTISSDNSGVGGYTGAVTVNAGTLIVNGNISTSITTVASGGTIGGSGTTGELTVQTGGFINPGNSPGILSTGNYTQLGLYTAEINSLTPGTGHDQINVAGTVNITGGTLATLFTGSYALNDMIFILLNDGSDAITGTFTGLAQGVTAVTYGGFDWKISYQGNSGGSPSFLGGNDIVLQAIPEPSSALLGAIGMVLLLRRRR